MPRTATKRKTENQDTSSQPAITLRGTVIRRRFHNADNGYCVLVIDTAEEEGLAAVGNMPTVREGDEYSFTGTFKEHPAYGRQFSFTASELIMPSGRAGVARYLSQVTFGVGIKKAEKIVEALGEDALDKIKADPSILDTESSLSFLSEEQRRDIIADLQANSVQAELASMICRPGSNIGMGTVARIMARFGKDAVRVVKENPYVLTEELFGIGFRKADVIAQAAGVATDSPYRVEAALSYVLGEAGAEGHVFLEPKNIVAKLLGGVRNGQKEKGLIEASGVVIEDVRRANAKLISDGKAIREGDAVYSKGLYDAEIVVAGAVRGMIDGKLPAIPDIEALIDEVEKRMN